MSDLSRGESTAVIKDISIGLFSALYVNFGKSRLDLDMLSVCIGSSACEELETGCRMKTCICGRHGGIHDWD